MVLVWMDHGMPKVISGDWQKIKEKVIEFMKFYYEEKDVEYVAESNSKFNFEKRVLHTTVDDECFEHFEFVEIEEI